MAISITMSADGLVVPDHPIIPFIEGDGTGRDITPVMRKVVDAAVAKAYGGKRSIAWMEVYAGEKAVATYGNDAWLPDETLRAVKDYVVSIKGPLTTPVGGGIRSLNVTLRQELDLYVCLRPVRYFKGVPSPVKQPEKVDMVIFRENSEDIYAGIEWPSGSPEARPSIRIGWPGWAAAGAIACATGDRARALVPPKARSSSGTRKLCTKCGWMLTCVPE